jgi:hypothetical protein
MRDWMDDAPDVAFVATRRVKAARKQYACGGCRDPILPGTPYERQAGVEDGQFFVFRSHWPACPRDVAENERQAREDEALFNTGVR